MHTIDDAAALLNCLSDDTAAAVMSRLDGDVQRRLSESTGSGKTISGPDLHRLTRKFRKEVLGGGKQSKTEAEDTLLWSEAAGTAQDEPFAFLKYLESDIRKGIVETEHPLHVAMILATLPSAFASAVMREIDPAFRMSVMRRLCEIDVVDDAKLMELRFQLRMRAKKALAIANCSVNGMHVAAKILSLSDMRTRDSVMVWLNDQDPELASEVKRRVIAMDSILELDEEQLGKLMCQVDTSAWAGALRSTLPSVAQRVLKSMAPRAAEIVSLEMAQFNPLDENRMQWAVEQVVGKMLEILEP